MQYVLHTSFALNIFFIVPWKPLNGLEKRLLFLHFFQFLLLTYCLCVHVQVSKAVTPCRVAKAPSKGVTTHSHGMQVEAGGPPRTLLSLNERLQAQDREWGSGLCVSGSGSSWCCPGFCLAHPAEASGYFAVCLRPNWLCAFAEVRFLRDPFPWHTWTSEEKHQASVLSFHNIEIELRL